MEQTINTELTQEEASNLSKLLEECLVKMRQANEQMAQDQIEIEQMQNETRAVIMRLGQKAA
jgi:hypothetical protein